MAMESFCVWNGFSPYGCLHIENRRARTRANHPYLLHTRNVLRILLCWPIIKGGRSMDDLQILSIFFLWHEC